MKLRMLFASASFVALSICSTWAFGLLGEENAQVAARDKGLQSVEPPIGLDQEEYKANQPPMSAIKSLQEHVKICESEYKKIRTLCAHQAKGGEVLPQLKVYYYLRMARAKLCWAQSEWTQCSAEASAAVAAGKAILDGFSAGYEPDENPFLARAEASEMLTDARLLLDKATAKASKAKHGANPPK